MSRTLLKTDACAAPLAGLRVVDIAVVELDEGVRMTTNVVGSPNAELWIGMPLEVTFEQVSEGIAIPKFRRST